MTDREIVSVIFVNWQIIGKKIYWLHYAKFGKITCATHVSNLNQIKMDDIKMQSLMFMEILEE